MNGKIRKISVYTILALFIGLPCTVFAEGQFPIGYGATFKPQAVKCRQVAKKSIFMQPPYQNASGKVLGTYKLLIMPIRFH